MTDQLAAIIDAAWDARDAVSPATRGEVRDAIEAAIEPLDSGERRVAEKVDGTWQVNQWLKKAVLLSFRLHPMVEIPGGPGGAPWWDKVDSKFLGWDRARFAEAGFRAVPGAIVRRGAFIAPGAVLMPSFVNLGAYVGEGTMVDTWATVGSCAQIGRNVHISGGTGIGGVLEPLQAGPVIIEDDCFIGARSEVAEACRRTGRGDFDGRVPRRIDQGRRPRHWRSHLRPGSGLFGGRAGHAAVGQGRPRACLRRDRQARRRADAIEDLNQRAVARLINKISQLFRD